MQWYSLRPELITQNIVASCIILCQNWRGKQGEQNSDFNGDTFNIILFTAYQVVFAIYLRKKVIDSFNEIANIFYMRKRIQKWWGLEMNVK